MSSARTLYLALVSLTIAAVLAVDVAVAMPWPLAVSNLGILLVTAWGMQREESEAFSLRKITHCFFFVFFGLIPVYEFATGAVYWDGARPTRDAQLLGNVLTLAGLIAFELGAWIRLPTAAVERIAARLEPLGPVDRPGARWVLLLASLLAGAAIFALQDFSLPKLLFRGVVEDELGVALAGPAEPSAQTLGLLADNILRPFPVMLFLVVAWTMRWSRPGRPGPAAEGHWLAWALLGVAVVFVAPTSISRFLAGALYFPILVLLASRPLHQPYRLQILVIAGVTLVMPLLDKFRQFSAEEFTWRIDFGFFGHGHFDAYQNFVRAVDADFVNWGWQLLGTLLFFVPRSVWPDKPIGSGAQLAEVVGLSFSNISMPFPAEGYINFGTAGVILFMGVLGALLAALDRLYWRQRRQGKASVYWIFYHFMQGMMFFVMRGDLMSSFAYTIAVTVSFMLACTLVRVLSRPRWRGAPAGQPAARAVRGLA